MIQGRITDDLTPVVTALPAKVRPRRPGGALLFGITTLALAFGSGIGATVAYDYFVALDGRYEGQTREDVELPAAGAYTNADGAPAQAPEEPIDPLKQALAMLGPQLPELAFYDVRPVVKGDVAFLTGEASSRKVVALIAEAIGQVPGIRAVDTRQVKLVDRVYELQPGDTLTRVAHRFYGYPGDWRRLADANPQMNPDYLRVGQKVRIPPPDR